MKNADIGLTTRRTFTKAAAFTLVPRHVIGGAGYIAPSDKITIATIGLGRQGLIVMMTELLPRSDVKVIALCDVNRVGKDYAEYSKNGNLNAARRLLAPDFESWGVDLASPGDAQYGHFHTSLGFGGLEPAKRVVDAYYGRDKSAPYGGVSAYRDYRELLATARDLDAVYIATSDHWHAPISIAAVKKGKHVLCQKPMAHSIGEAHRMAEVARETGVATAVPINNPSSADTEVIAKWIADGAIGKVMEVRNWSSRLNWQNGLDRPKDEMAVPPSLDWDMWVGPAAMRSYHSIYLPYLWRAWYDFGSGSFGDMGCYSFAGVFKILDLTPPVAVEACTTDPHVETYPNASVVYMDFPAHTGRGPVRFVWYEGGMRPQRPTGLSPQQEALFATRTERSEGIMYVGDKGLIIGGFNGTNPRVYPESPKYQRPPATAQAATPGTVGQWVAACRGGKPALTSFEIQCPVTEAFQLGCLAERFPDRKLAWDSANTRITNDEKVNACITPSYRSAYAI